MSVRSEKNGPVTTVILDRPEVRNAVDRDTAHALSAAFDAFEADEAACVAVLWGRGFFVRLGRRWRRRRFDDVRIPRSLGSLGGRGVCWASQ